LLRKNCADADNFLANFQKLKPLHIPPFPAQLKQALVKSGFFKCELPMFPHEKAPDSIPSGVDLTMLANPMLHNLQDSKELQDATRKLNDKQQANYLTVVGVPGVSKTTLLLQLATKQFGCYVQCIDILKPRITYGDGAEWLFRRVQDLRDQCLMKKLMETEFDSAVGNEIRCFVAVRALSLLLWLRDRSQCNSTPSGSSAEQWLAYQLNGGAEDITVLHQSLQSDAELRGFVSREMLKDILAQVEQKLGHPMTLLLDEAQICLLDKLGSYPWPSVPSSPQKASRDVVMTAITSSGKEEKPNEPLNLPNKGNIGVLFLQLFIFNVTGCVARFLERFILEMCQFKLHLVLSGTYFRLPTAITLAHAVSTQFKLQAAQTASQVCLVESFPWIAEPDSVWRLVKSCLDVSHISQATRDEFCSLFYGRTRFVAFFVAHFVVNLAATLEKAGNNASKDAVFTIGMNKAIEAMRLSVVEDLENKTKLGVAFNADNLTSRLACLCRMNMFRSSLGAVPSSRQFPELLHGLCPIWGSAGVVPVSSSDRPRDYLVTPLEPLFLLGVSLFFDKYPSKLRQDMFLKATDQSFAQVLPKLRGTYLDYIVMQRLVERKGHSVLKFLQELNVDGSLQQLPQDHWLASLSQTVFHTEQVIEHATAEHKSCLVGYVYNLCNELNPGCLNNVEPEYIKEHKIASTSFGDGKLPFTKVGVMPEPVAGMDGAICLLDDKSKPTLLTFSCAFYGDGVTAAKAAAQQRKAELEQQFQREHKKKRVVWDGTNVPLLIPYESESEYGKRRHIIQEAYQKLLQRQIHFCFELPQRKIRSKEKPSRIFSASGNHVYVVIDERNLDKFFDPAAAKALLESASDFNQCLTQQAESKSSNSQASVRRTATCTCSSKAQVTCKRQLCANCCQKQFDFACPLKTHRK
jgi:hypothetical protein